MTGKQKCAILKEIRRDIAKKNDINIRIDECTHRGECRGTCPRCEAEVKILERELEKKRKRGFQTAIAGVSAGILAASLASCVPASGDDVKPDTGTQIETLAGDVAAPETDEKDKDGETTFTEKTEGEVAVIDGMVANPDYIEPELAGEPPEEDYSGEDEFPLMGEPPVEDYDVEAYGGEPVADDCVIEVPGEPENPEEEIDVNVPMGKIAVVDLETEEPEPDPGETEEPEILAGMPLLPEDYLSEENGD